MKKLFGKVKNKGLKWLRRLVPHHTFYKPVRALESSKAYYQNNQQVSGLEFVEVYPAYTTSLKVPEDFLDAVPSYCMYDKRHHSLPSTLTVTTNYVVVALPHGRLYSNNVDMVAVISADGVLLGDVSLQYLPDRVASATENAIFKQAYFTPPVNYTGVVFTMLAGGGPIHNYGHWLVDVLPRIHLLKKTGWFDKVNWFVVPNYQHDFQKDSLKLLGIRKEQIIRGSDNLHITADLLIASTAPRGKRSYLMPQWLVDFHRASYLATISPTASYAPLIYISRRDGTTRKVLNEQPLIELLAQYNFQVIELSKLSFVEKINLFQYAKILVSVVGAAFANLVYCQPGTKALEVFPEFLVDTFDYNLATFVGVDYRYLILPSAVQTRKLTKATNADMTVDLPAVEKVVQQLCAEVKQEVR
ncbi:glycosyltransferase 61 family protein [Rhodocytophaga aerolata]|uniref:Glycosyltransferase 61 family protein n=1 Tax=Rhodocytophaga aerolata TaxID=455078 RepID=A0ABT8RCI2_9BACT|nr:glycosyltransferase 61 family protein [Rhodocytophaga aerolata]MDO1449411.1 glycosyltransferase 61 family protein [Rhodocytophaga aerolata]